MKPDFIDEFKKNYNIPDLDANRIMAFTMVYHAHRKTGVFCKTGYFHHLNAPWIFQFIHHPAVHNKYPIINDAIIKYEPLVDELRKIYYNEVNRCIDKTILIHLLSAGNVIMNTHFPEVYKEINVLPIDKILYEVNEIHRLMGAEYLHPKVLTEEEYGCYALFIGADTYKNYDQNNPTHTARISIFYPGDIKTPPAVPKSKTTNPAPKVKTTPSENGTLF